MSRIIEDNPPHGRRGMLRSLLWPHLDLSSFTGLVGGFACSILGPLLLLLPGGIISFASTSSSFLDLRSSLIISDLEIDD